MSADSGIISLVDETEWANPRNVRTSPVVPKGQHPFAASSESALRMMKNPRFRRLGGTPRENPDNHHVALPALGTLAERTASEVFVTVAVVCFRHRFGVILFDLRHAEQVAAHSELFLTVAVSQKPVIANAPEPVQQQQQETPDEFPGAEGHRFDLVASAIVFPLEPDLIVFDVEQAVIGDGDAVGIAAHVIEHLPGSCERSFGIDNPIALFQAGQMPGELRPFPERFQSAEELKFPASNALSRDSRKAGGTEKTEPGPARKVQPAGNPTITTKRRSAAGHDAMQVRMKLEVLSPTVQYGKEADFRTKVFGVRCDGFQSLGCSPEENAVDSLLVLESDCGNLFRHGEDDMKVRDLKKFVLAILKPLGSGQ